MKKWSFKKPLVSLAAVGISLSLIGCTASTTTTTKNTSKPLTSKSDKAAAPAPVHTDSVSIQYPAGMTSLDTSVWAAQILVNMGTTFEGLYGYDKNNKVVPKIASGYTVSKDGLTWTIHLRKDAKWSNGDPVTANDFYYAWMRMMDSSNTNAAIWAGITNVIKNGWQYHGGAVKASDVGLKVVDDYTLQITTAQPHNIIPYLALSSAMPLNKKVTEAHPKDWWLPANFVTDGPYVVKSFVQNGKVVLTKNPNYVPGPNDDQVGNIKTINLIPNTTVPVEAFMSKKIDVVQVNTPADLKYVQTHPQLQAQLQAQDDNTLYYLAFDHAPQASPLDNQKVRQAIAMAIDKQPIAKNVLSDLVGATDVFGNTNWPAASKSEKGLSYNLSQAKKLLAEAGYPNGKGFPTLALYSQTKTDNPNSVNIAMALAQELKQGLNINFKIEPLAATQYGGVCWGGQVKGITPGYVIASGTPNWSDSQAQTEGADQALFFPGTFAASATQRQFMSKWYLNPYNPDDVALWGDPNNNKMGTKASDWDAMNKSAQQDIAWMNNWISQQPEPYRTEEKPLTSYQDQWNQLYATWKSAKDDATKHADWVNAWKFLGTYSTGVGNVMVGLHDMVYYNKNQSADLANWRMLQTELANATTQDQGNQLTTELVTKIMQSGYAVPLFYQKTVFLERNGITGAQANPWSWGNFYQFQYLNSK